MREMVVAFVGRHANPSTVRIGNERDNLAERIRFELPVKGSAVLHLQHGAYSDIVGLEDGVYSPTRMQTQYPGKWTAYIEVMAEGDMVWHSDVFALLIGALPRDGEQIEQEYPTLFEDALNAAATLAQIEPAAETLPEGSAATVRREANADGSSRLVFGIPKGDQGNPGKQGERGLQGVQGIQGRDGATGPAGADGVSPTITVKAIEGGHQLTITDVNGTQTINIWDGKNTGGSGSGSGADGYSPTIAVEEIAGGHRLIITDVEGSRTVDVMDGSDGKAGADGQPGYTPQRGVDYWTAADIAEIKGYVDSAILGGEW